MTEVQNKLVVTLVKSVVALEKAEKKFDTSSKAIISLFTELVDGQTEGTLKAKALLVHTEMVTIIDGTKDLAEHTSKRIVAVVDTVDKHFQLGLKMRVEAIPFTDIQRVVDLVDNKFLTKSQVDKADKTNKEDTDYSKAIKDLITVGAYKQLVGNVDYSMLSDELVTTVKALSKDDIKGLAGLCKVQAGA